MQNNISKFIFIISLLSISLSQSNINKAMDLYMKGELSILTEDIGEIVDNRNCECNSRGKSFLVHGRALQSEIRGCSDI